jgi:glutamyl-tRNA synthetase
VDNLLAFLGWNPGTERELFSLKELIDAFSLERVGRSGSRFDPEKAKWYNQQYLKNHSDEELALRVMPVLDKKGIKTDLNYLTRVVSMVRERMIFPQDLWDQAVYFFKAPDSYDAQQQKKVWKSDTPAIMSDTREILLNAVEFGSASLESLVRQYVEEKELGFGRVMAPLRLLLVGSGMGPHLFDIMEMIGKEETIRRIDRGIVALGTGQ